MSKLTNAFKIGEKMARRESFRRATEDPALNKQLQALLALIAVTIGCWTSVFLDTKLSIAINVTVGTIVFAYMLWRKVKYEMENPKT